VHISETIDLAQRLKQKGVRFEELLLPDETHDWLRFKSWLTVTNASARFLTRELSPPSP
jgi:dipeptidyl aminopeptidase/acylaminoacyl peptidase